MKEVFGGMPRSRLALETGTHSPWVSRVLSELGHEVIVAHARNVRLIGESRKKDDRLDARMLARRVRIDPKLLAPVKQGSAQAQADLMAIRARAGLVRARTSLINTARGVTKSYGERLRGCSPRNMNPVKAQELSPELKTALESLLGAIESLSERIVARIPAFAKTMRIFQRQHVGQRDQRPHFLHLFQSRHLRVTLLRDLLDALGDGGYLNSLM